MINNLVKMKKEIKLIIILMVSVRFYQQN